VSDVGVVVYECVRCGFRAALEEWEKLGWKCPNCLYKVARKMRPPIAKRIKAI